VVLLFNPASSQFGIDAGAEIEQKNGKATA